MFLIVLGLFVILLFIYLKSYPTYWQKKGVEHIKLLPNLNLAIQMAIQRVSISEVILEIYKKFPEEKFIGLFLGTQKAIVIRDPELIKHVLVTDFHYFYSRGINVHKTVVEPMMKNLFTVDGDVWKLLRQRLTPAFTSGKLKAMFPLIVERAEKLQSIALVAARSGKEVDIRDLMARYATDFIGACGFGIDADALDEEDSTFRKLGRRIFTITKRDMFAIFLKLLAPETFKNVHFFAPEIHNNTVALVTSIMEQRNHKYSGRNDFIDLLLELKEKGKIFGESVEKRNADGTPKIVDLELDDLLMAAQVFVFFAAGFETSSSTTSFTLHQLAFYPEEQRKCQDEIDMVLTRHGGKLSYEAVKEMKYLEMVLRESLRMYPPLGYIIRRCEKNYTIPETDVIIDENTMIFCAIHAMQNDEKYFDEPEKFKPERFHPDNVNNIKKHVYLPFGEGSRACIGERLGLMQSLAGLAAVLSHFSVAPSKSTLRYPVPDPCSTIVQTFKGGLPLALVARNKTA